MTWYKKRRVCINLITQHHHNTLDFLLILINLDNLLIILAAGTAVTCWRLVHVVESCLEGSESDGNQGSKKKIAGTLRCSLLYLYLVSYSAPNSVGDDSSRSLAIATYLLITWWGAVTTCLSRNWIPAHCATFMTGKLARVVNIALYLDSNSDPSVVHPVFSITYDLLCRELLNHSLIWSTWTRLRNTGVESTVFCFRISYFGKCFCNRYYGRYGQWLTDVPHPRVPMYTELK